MKDITFNIKTIDSNNILVEDDYKLSVSSEYYDMNIGDRLKYLELLTDWTKKEMNNINKIIERTSKGL